MAEFTRPNTDQSLVFALYESLYLYDVVYTVLLVHKKPTLLNILYHYSVSALRISILKVLVYGETLSYNI